MRLPRSSLRREVLLPDDWPLVCERIDELDPLFWFWPLWLFWLLWLPAEPPLCFCAEPLLAPDCIPLL